MQSSNGNFHFMQSLKGNFYFMHSSYWKFLLLNKFKFRDFLYNPSINYWCLFSELRFYIRYFIYKRRKNKRVRPKRLKSVDIERIIDGDYEDLGDLLPAIENPFRRKKNNKDFVIPGTEIEHIRKFDIEDYVVFLNVHL